MSVRGDAAAWVGAGLAVAGIAWLGPLMVDQMTFFGDRDQEADAAAARALMPLPAALLAAGAALITSRGQPLSGAMAALPLVSVALAWATPAALYQLLACGLSAPFAVGSVLATTVPLGGGAPRPVLLALAVAAAAAAIIATPVLAGLAVLTLVAWRLLSRDVRLARAAG